MSIDNIEQCNQALKALKAQADEIYAFLDQIPNAGPILQQAKQYAGDLCSAADWAEYYTRGK